MNTLRIVWFTGKDTDAPVSHSDLFDFTNDEYIPLNDALKECEATYLDIPESTPKNVSRGIRKNTPAKCTVRFVKDLDWVKGSPGGVVTDPFEKYSEWGLADDDLDNAVKAHEAITQAITFLNKKFKEANIKVTATLYHKGATKVE